MTCLYCNPTNERGIVRGSVEYLTGFVDANVEIEDDMAIAVTFNRTDWDPAAWLAAGVPNTHRHWQILVGTISVPLPDVSSAVVYVKITDNPEEPILKAGRLKVY